jgi:hypothetical protein
MTKTWPTEGRYSAIATAMTAATARLNARGDRPRAYYEVGT